MGATCNDNIDGPITNITVNASAVDTANVGSYTVTYDCRDAAGNPAVQLTRTVTVVAAPDTVPPVIELIGPATVSITQGTTYADMGATCNDNIDGPITNITIDESAVDTANVGSYTVTYDCRDAAGNPAVQLTRTVTVVAAPDTLPPVIELIGPATVSITQGTTYADMGATCNDNIDGPITNITVNALAVDTANVGSYTVTYDCRDAAGNPAVQLTRTVTVVTAPDTVPPVIELIGPATVSITQGTTYADMGATCNDNIDGPITNITVNALAVDTANVGSYTVTYDCRDAAGNPAVQLTRTVTVVAAPDTLPPVIELIGPATVSITQGTTYADMGATCNDNIDGPITNITVNALAVDTANVGSYTVTYDCRDAAGNPAVQLTRTVTVVAAPDTVPPVIELIGPATVSITQGTTYADMGATCNDNIDGPITNITVNALAVDTVNVGSYTVTYDCQDAAGNPAVQLTRTVTVVAAPDTLPPVIELIGPATVSITQGTTYADMGATCNDNIDGPITNITVNALAVDTANVGSYTVTYDCRDAAGNPAVQLTRTVTVVAAPDTVPPVIELIGPATVSITQGTTYADMGATCNDNIDGPITNITVNALAVDTANVGSYTVTYDCRDAAGNPAVQLTRTVTVVAAPDTVPPTLVPADTTTIPLVLNLDTSTLSLTFDETIDVSATATDEITVTDNTGTNGIVLTGAGLPDPDSDSETLVITLTESQRLDIIALYIGTNVPLKLDVTATAIADISGNLFAGLTGAELQVTVTDVVFPTVTSATTFDISSIDLIFSENVIIDSPSLNDFAIVGLLGPATILSVGEISENSLRLRITGSVISDTDLSVTLSYTRTDGSIRDSIGNPLADFTDLAITNTLDTTRPIPVITLNPPDTFIPTGLDMIPITVTFSEPVTGFEQSDMLIVNGVLSSLLESTTSDGTTYHGVVTPSAVSGIVSVTVPFDVAHDDRLNGNIAAILDVPVDRVGPTVLSAQTLSATTVTLLLSEPVTLDGVAPASFTISGTDAGLPFTRVNSVALLSGTANAVVKLTLDAAAGITGSDTPTVSYTRSAGTVSDASGNVLSDFEDVSITNNVPNPPAVLSVYAISPDGTYLIDETVEIAVLFTKPVTVTAGTGGNPSLLLETGTDDGTAVYTGVASNSNNILKFTYAVAAGDLSNDLQYLDTAALRLPSGTIITEFGVSNTVNATTTLPDLSGDKSLASNSNIVINGISTQIIRAEMRGENSLEVSYDRAVTVAADHYTNLAIGNTTRNVLQVYGSGTSDILISFDGPPTDLDTGGTVDIDTHAVKMGQIISARSENGTFIDNDPITLVASDITNNLVVSDEITTILLTPVLGLYPLGTDSTLVMPPSLITITFDHDANGINDVYVTFAPNTVVSNLGPEQTVTMSVSTKTVMPDAIPTGTSLANNVIVDLGDPARDLQFDTPVIIDLVNKAEDTGFFVDAAGFTRTVAACSTDHVEAAAGSTIAEIVSAKVELRTSAVDECSVNVGADLRIYSLHFSGWGGFTESDDVGGTSDPAPRNRNTGGGGGGGGGSGGGRGASTPPSFTTSFATGTDTIVINNVGIAPKPFKLLYVQDKPITVQTDKPIPFSFTLYDDESWQSITHLEMCINKSLSNNSFCDGDTKIIWDKNNRNGAPEIIDPNNVINTATITVSKTSPHVATFDFTITFDGMVNTTRPPDPLMGL